MEAIYQKIKLIKTKSEELDRYVAVICGEYAQVFYGNDYTTSKKLRLEILGVQLFKMVDADLTSYDSLKDWKDKICSRTGVPALEGILATIDPKAVLEMLGSYSDEHKFEIAMTFRWLGACYHNTSPYKDDLKTYGNLFFAVYGATEEILKLIENKNDKYKIELTELYYNTNYFLHLIKNPLDDKGAAQCFMDILKRDNSLSMQARVFNWQAILSKDPMKKLFNINLVIEIRKQITEKDPSFGMASLYANAKNNYANIVVKYKITDKFDVAEALLKEAIAFVVKEDEKNNDHSYFGMYYITYAKLKLVQSDITAALNHINEAIKRLTKHQESSADILKEASFFKSALEQILQKMSQVKK